MMKENWNPQQNKPLLIGLAISLVLNAFLMTHFFYVLFAPPRFPVAKYKMEQEEEKWLPYSDTKSAVAVLEKYQSLGFEKLISKLEDSDLIEYGYTQRDLALALLVAEYQFDLKRALKGKVLKKRIWTFGDGEEQVRLEVFPGLKSYEFEKILSFAKREKWPLTVKGLYHNLKKLGKAKDASLVKAFCLTPEFKDIQRPFGQLNPPIDQNDLLSMIMEGDYELFQQFHHKFRIEKAPDKEMLRGFLMEYILNNSETAVQILLQFDSAFAVKNLPDEYTLHMLSLIKTPTPESHAFIQELLKSPRGSDVMDGARKVLTKFKGKGGIKEAPAIKEPPKQKSAMLAYTVKEGDTLWSLSRQFGVSINRIREENDLWSDILKPGSQLNIPTSISADRGRPGEKGGI